MHKNADDDGTALLCGVVGKNLRCTECCWSSWFFVKFFVLKWSVRPRVRAFRLHSADDFKLKSGILRAGEQRRPSVENVGGQKAWAKTGMGAEGWSPPVAAIRE